jgi:UDP-glucose 4-epimerase
MKVLVTGGSGLIGRELIQSIIEEGYSVIALEHSTPIPFQKIAKIKGDIRDRECVRKLVEGADTIIKLSSAKRREEVFIETNLRGLYNLLEECRQKERRRFIHTSGDATYGIWYYEQLKTIDETHPPTAYPDRYAMSLVLEDAMCDQYRIMYNMPISTLRPSWVLPAEDSGFVEHFMTPCWEGYLSDKEKADLKKGIMKLVVVKDRRGKPIRRHVVHVRDVASAFLLVLKNDKSAGNAYNIASPAPFNYEECAIYLSKELKIPVIEVSVPEAFSFEISIKKAEKELGYKPKYDTNKMLEESLVAFKKKGRKEG